MFKPQILLFCLTYAISNASRTVWRTKIRSAYTYTWNHPRPHHAPPGMPCVFLDIKGGMPSVSYSMSLSLRFNDMQIASLMQSNLKQLYISHKRVTVSLNNAWDIWDS